MKPVLFVGDSHLARIELGYNELKADDPGIKDAAFLCAPGIVSNLVEFRYESLGLREDFNYLRNHPAAPKHDFEGWYDLCKGRLREIEVSRGLALANFSSIVLVSFQLFNPELWASATLAMARGELSKQAWATQTDRTYQLHHGRLPSRHFHLLKQLGAQRGIMPPVYSLPTPPRSAMADFPSSLLRQGETIGKRAFRTAEDAYAQRIKSNFCSEMLRCPDELLAENGITIRKEFQFAPHDFTHLDVQGSKILISSALKHVQ